MDQLKQNSANQMVALLQESKDLGRGQLPHDPARWTIYYCTRVRKREDINRPRHGTVEASSVYSFVVRSRAFLLFDRAFTRLYAVPASLLSAHLLTFILSKFSRDISFTYF